MAQAVSRRPLTAETRVRFRVSPCEICGGQSGTGTVFFSELSVFPCQFHSTGAPSTVKLGKKNCSSSSQGCTRALRLRCVRGICCGALHNAKKNSTTLRTGRSGNRIPVEARFSAPVHTGSGAFPASCTMGTGYLSRG
jgi:hypothetical protein